MEVLNKLKESNKGQLNYERKTDFGRLSDDLKNCTSPPLRTFSGVFHSVIVEEKGESSDESQDISFNDKLLMSNESDENDKKDVPLCPTEYVHSKLAVLEYEAIYDNKITLAVKKKCQEFEENEKNLNIKTSLELEDLYKQKAIRDACRYEKLKAQQKQLVEEGEKYQKELREQHIHHNETAISKVQEAKLKRKQLEEAAKKEREMKLEQLREQQKKILLSCKTFSYMRSQCEHMEYLSDKMNKSLELVTKLNQMSTAILNQAENTGGATNEHFNETISIAEQLDSINAKMKQIIEEANKKAKEQQQKQQQIAAQQQQQQQQQNNVPQNSPTSVESVASSTPNTTKKQEKDNEENKALKIFSKFIDPEALKEYLRLQAKLKEVEAHLDAFLNNVQLKEYRFKIRKAANILINAISPLSGSHLKDKLNKLTLLLQGQNIEVSNKYISAKDQPEGIMFAKYLVAKMLVKKGAEQVSSSHESAYAIATVIVGLWVNFPDLGDLLLANFHLACPYIVPYYIPQEDDQSTEKHQKMLGYKYENGKIEGQEKFLTRMTGIMRLYAAIMVSPLPPGVNKPHPHGVENCWSWMTRTINIEPRPDITAAVIYNLLEVTSHALFTNYRKPFQKFLHILITEFLPKIKAVSPSVGSVSRLETFLEAKVKNMGQISKPAGLITHSFWFT